MIAAGLLVLVGAASALAYGIRRRWIDALLALAAALALAGLVGQFALPAGANMASVVTIDSDRLPPDIGKASALSVSGDGLRESQWRDLPALPLTWKVPATETLQLDFPRQLALGRMFSLTVTRSKAGVGRLQLLAENGQVIADAGGSGKEITVRWLPPVAEALVLKAQLLDGAGKVVAQGPIPLVVRAAAPLQVQGRFGAPSFDANALNELLANSHAVLDWQVTLGKTVTRAETPRAEMAEPSLLVTDAAYLEHLNPGARAALLARVAAGMPMIILAANASDTAFWSRELELALKAQSGDKAVGTPAMAVAPFNPAGAAAGPWAAASEKIWVRRWQQGRIMWLGLADWHRYAISEPQALALWWQGVLDQAGVQRLEDVVWQLQDELPLPGQRLELCALGARGNVTFPGLRQGLAWERRADKADASCVAVWPREPGWLKLDTQGAQRESAQLYVYDKGDWPAWQSAQRRAATARYAARTPASLKAGAAALPAWPFALAFIFAMLGLWWRERR